MEESRQPTGGTRFFCTLCGDCCTGNQVVRLGGFDLDLLVQFLGLGSVGDLKGRGVELVRESVGQDLWVWRPRIRFRTRPLRQCPFLVNDLTETHYRGLCSLHPQYKPLVCLLSPWAREVEDGPQGAHETWSVVAPVEGCPGMGRGEPLGAPTPDLTARLNAEVQWMRAWIQASEALATEAEAWKALQDFSSSSNSAPTTR